MASTFSNLKIQLMATGENSGTWGNVTNDNLGVALEEAIVGSADVTFASGNVTLTLTDTNASQTARNLRLNLTGTTGGARDLIVPAIEKVYIVNNGCADTITVKVAGQTGVAVPADRSYLLYNNGTDVVNALVGISPASGGTGLNAPGNSGNVLTSNGTAWVSQAAAAFDSGTVMLFAQTSAPTGWTKNTSTGDQHALRIVTGTASSGGSVDFTTAFASQTPTGSVSVSGSVGNTTLSTPQIPSHEHSISGFNPGSPVLTSVSQSAINAYYGGAAVKTTSAGRGANPTGGGGAHNHPFSTSSATFSGNAINLAVKFVDVIRATKA
jgi:hypothetical protein